jgi:hypothetical protein
VAKGVTNPAQGSIDLSELETGTYVLKMENEHGEVKSVKVVKL